MEHSARRCHATLYPEATDRWGLGVPRVLWFFLGRYTLEPTQKNQEVGGVGEQNLPLPHVGRALRRARIYQGKTLRSVQTRLGLGHLNEVILLERRPNIKMHLVLRFMAAIEMDPKRLFDFMETRG